MIYNNIKEARITPPQKIAETTETETHELNNILLRG